MDLVPILNAAIKATGGNPNKDHVDASDLERAQKALRYVDAHISKSTSPERQRRSPSAKHSMTVAARAESSAKGRAVLGCKPSAGVTPQAFLTC